MPCILMTNHACMLPVMSVISMSLFRMAAMHALSFLVSVMVRCESCLCGVLRRERRVRELVARRSGGVDLWGDTSSLVHA